MMESMKYAGGVKEKANMDGVYIEDLGPLDFVYTQPSVDEMNMQLNQTRSQRIRAAMFPESLEDYGYQHPQQNGQQPQQQQQQPNNGMRPTAVQKLSQPTNKLKTAIVHLINYQEDADVTIKAIPELVKLLNDEERPVVCRALKLIEQLSRKDASRLALASSQDLVASLVQLILNTHDAELHHAISTILNNVCSGANKQALYLIFKSGGIPALIKLLASPLEPVLYYAITTLHNLLMYEPNAKAQVHHYNGTRKMVELLASPHGNKNPKFLAMLMDCLHILAYNNSEVKLVIQTSGGPQEIVRIMRSFNYHKLTWTSVRLMKVLSVCPENKRVLVENGAMQALSACLQSPQCSQDHRILYNCLLTLRNLSDCAIREDNLEGLIKRLIELLHTNTDFNVSTCAAGILSNLTCNNDLNKMKFVEYNGVETILKAMLQAGSENKEDICEPAVCTLRHVTNRHPQAATAQEQVRYFYGLPVISPLLEPETSRWPLLKATIGLVRNLALSDNNLAPLKELGIIARLVQLLIKAINAHQQAQAQGLEQAIVDDVAMEEIIEGAVGALHQLARDHHNGAVIRDLKCIPVLVQLLYMHWEGIQRVACGCLSELANDRTNLELIDAEHITDKLTDLLKSNDHAISTYAAAVLLRLSEFKPPAPSNGVMSASVDASAIYSAANTARNLNNIGSNDQYVSYNTIDPYELEMHNPPHYSQMQQLVDVPPSSASASASAAAAAAAAASHKPHPTQHQNQQSPATWFDTDL